MLNVRFATFVYLPSIAKGDNSASSASDSVLLTERRLRWSIFSMDLFFSQFETKPLKWILNIFFPRHDWLITPFIVSSLHLCNAAAPWWHSGGPRQLNLPTTCSGIMLEGPWHRRAVGRPFEEGWKGGRHLPGCRKLPAVSPTGGWKQCLTSPPAASLR